jgi:shikimate kinase
MASSPRSAERLVLVGMMGSGKTSVGRLVASALGRPLLDSDEQVEANAGRSVRDIFESEGEAAFRRLESEALEEALARSAPVVVAAAGGVVLSPSNRSLLRRRATVVWLRARPETLARRVGEAGHRPLLGDDPAAALARLDAERRPLYEEVADAVVDVDDIDAEQAASAVLAAVGPPRGDGR